MHLYAFGSVCRGEIARDSDIDLLALVSGHDDRLDPAKYSIYSYRKMKAMWRNGNPFAWHLSRESRLLFAQDERDFLGSLGQPAPYSNCHQDCRKFYGVYLEALSSLDRDMASGGVRSFSNLPKYPQYSDLFLRWESWARLCFPGMPR